MKRAFDIILAAGALVILAVPMLAVALAVRLHDSGPVLFRQHRVGRGGRDFEILKFRSMVVDAGSLGGYATAPGDKRITPIGRFIRRTSLDELPQLLNILIGDMSVVGPRPDVPAQQGLYSPDEWTLRHSVRPGLTGLAQATARSSASHEQRTALDLQYVRSISLLLDVQIIFLTLRRIISRAGN